MRTAGREEEQRETKIQLDKLHRVLPSDDMHMKPQMLRALNKTRKKCRQHAQGRYVVSGAVSVPILVNSSIFCASRHSKSGPVDFMKRPV